MHGWTWSTNTQPWFLLPTALLGKGETLHRMCMYVLFLLRLLFSLPSFLFSPPPFPSAICHSTSVLLLYAPQVLTWRVIKSSCRGINRVALIIFLAWLLVCDKSKQSLFFTPQKLECFKHTCSSSAGVVAECKLLIFDIDISAKC